MVTQPGLHDNDLPRQTRDARDRAAGAAEPGAGLVLWTQLLGEVLNGEVLQRLSAEHPRIRYAHGFLIQQLVEGPRPVGEIASNLGVTSQAVSKTVRELEGLGYVDRGSDPADGRVRRVALTDRGHAVLEAGRSIRAALNAELVATLGADRVAAAADTLRAALEARGAMPAINARRVRPAEL